MNRRIINSIISRKINNWIKSIKDDSVKSLVKSNTIVTGGCIPSMFLKEPISDYDIYFRNKETAMAVAKYYVKEFKTGEIEVCDEEEGRVNIIIPSTGIAEKETVNELEDFQEIINEKPVKEEKKEEPELEKYRLLCLTSNAITLSDKIQLIVRFYGEPEDIHKNYDFIHCTCYWDILKRKVVCPEGALESLLTKQLYYSGSKYPVCSMIRIRKFMKRGWHINGGQMLKIAFQISELDLCNLNVLKDQLVGVDMSYFIQIIDNVKAAQEENKDFKIDSNYLSKLIDKIF